MTTKYRRALSIKQPWSWLICKGIKDIENRSWRTNFRGRILIHAGKRFDHDALEWLMDKGLAPFNALMLFSDKIERGAIVGEATITDCVTKSDSPWFVGDYGFVLADPLVYETPIPYRGRQRWFKVEEGVVREASDRARPAREG